MSQTVAEPEQDSRAVGYACACAIVLIFSSFTLMSRLGLKSSLGIMDVAALRFTVAGLLMLPVLLRARPAGLSWRDVAVIVSLGGLGFALLAYTGFLLAPASHGAVLLHGTLPLFTFLLAPHTSRDCWKQGRGILLIALGIALMVSDSLSNASIRQLLGDGALLLASLFWSLYAIRTRRLGLPPAHAAALVAVTSMCCYLPVYLAATGGNLPTLRASEWLLQALFQGILIGALSIYLYTRAVASLGASQTALFTAAVPCLTTICAGPLLHEYPSTTAWIGVVVVTIGMIVAMLGLSQQAIGLPRR